MQINKDILQEIKRQINSKSFHKTALYKMLRDELSGIGNWKAKPRGRPDINNFITNQSPDGGPIAYKPTSTIKAPGWIDEHNREFTQ